MLPHDSCRLKMRTSMSSSGELVSRVPSPVSRGWEPVKFLWTRNNVLGLLNQSIPVVTVVTVS
jgi:hypothetical protein